MDSLYDAVKHSFDENHDATSQFMSLFGNIWLVYSVFVGYELFRRPGKPYGLPLKVASLFLFTAFFYIILSSNFHRIQTIQ